VLLGRTAECAAIDRLLDGARSGGSGVIVLRGAPGIGKSVLLDYAAARAGDFTVLRVTGVESEIALSFAAIHQLVLPFLHRVDELPEPQRHALESVLGLADHAAPDSLLVFLAILTLLDNLSRERPLLILIDDAQWVDDESGRVLTFVARRLHADPIMMLFAVRDTGSDAADVFHPLPHMTVGGLPEPDARSVLEDAAGGAIDPAVASRVVSQTQGNPLALVEVVAELSTQQLQGNVPLPEPLPVGRSLQDHFVARARLLPPESRTVLLIASAERLGDPALTYRAANMGACWDEAVASIEAAELAAFSPTVRFRHPLIRSAVYHGATLAERRQAHHALADALDGDENVERRAWHLAAAAATPDEDVARALAEAGERVFRRGGTQAAAQFLLRASELTLDPVRKVDRLLEAVRLRAAEGAAARAQPLLDTVFEQVQEGRQQAEAEWTQGLIWLTEGRGRDAARILARAIASIEHYDDGFPLDALITAENAAVYTGSLRDSSLEHEIAAAALRMVPEVRSATPTELLVRAMAVRLEAGHTASAPSLRAAVASLRQQIEESGDVAMPSLHDRANMVHLLAVNAAAAILDDAAIHAVTHSWVELGRRTRTLTTLPIALDLRSVSEIFAGRLRAAASAIAEADEILSFVGSRGHIGDRGLGQLFLYAYRGDEEETRTTARRRTYDALERGSGADLDQSHYALAVLDLGWGRYAAALEHCSQIDELISVPFSTLSLPIRIEAAVRCDERQVADAALDRFARRATASGSEWALGLLGCARALCTEGDEAERWYCEGLERLYRSRAAFDLARGQLLYGEWLRRERRRSEARRPLRTALEFFEGIGARAFAERARRELTATGEHSRPRSDATRDLLTPQEAQIARLVADGKKNAEIASQLYISRSTVEYHLRKIYRKLGITTRTQLARVELAG
jgi:DNA-binding CsgD family transcriptional regulator